MPDITLQQVVSRFGIEVKGKLSSYSISGQPEDQLRAPLEQLIKAIGELAGFNPSDVKPIGETTIAGMQTRPDYAVEYKKALIGFIEVKAPGKGCDPRNFSDSHDKTQWGKLKLLPNLIYTDGNGFSLWRDGKLTGKIVLLDGNVKDAGAKLTAPDALVQLFADFLSWNPITPKSPKALAETSARLCRFLRDEVLEEMALGNLALTRLKNDWRMLLFPNADDAQFADGYAQAVTFGLLVARAYDIPLKDGIDLAALKLKKSNTLIGTALGILTGDEGSQKTLKTSISALLRVLHEVNWHEVLNDKPEAWLYFYEDFLGVYDNALKKKTGSYYTPPEVVEAMVRLVDEALKGPLFERKQGLASSDVTIADPAVGTGTFLLGILRHIAEEARKDGDGMVAGAVAAAAKRMFGFELQFGPFAVAQLRLLAEMRAYMAPANGQAIDDSAPVPEVNLYITDTLGNPFAEEEQLPQIVEAVAKSRRDANRVKKGQPITVVIGNPPYKEKAKGLGGWIEQGAGGKLVSAMDRWRPPVEWGVSAHSKHLKNLYVFFWRWAAMKVFGAGLKAATGLDEQDEEGIVCYITVAGFLNGPGFEKMRDDLRRTCSEIWVIDCSPEGHQPDVPTRIFEGVQQPVCIVLATKQKEKSGSRPAKVRFIALKTGSRTEKFRQLKEITLHSGDWQNCQQAWRAPFLPEAVSLWGQMPSLNSLFSYNGSGVMTGRTWIISPDKQSLENRWNRLKNEKDTAKSRILFHPHIRNGNLGDKHFEKSLADKIEGQEFRGFPVSMDEGSVPRLKRYAFRTLDRQYIIADGRLINQSNPKIWKSHSERQIYITAIERAAPKSGPALSLSALIPDLDHYKGSFGGRVYPLYADSKAENSNFKPALFDVLAAAYGARPSAEDVFAYIAGVMAHPAFTARFQSDLKQPGLRVPFTADAALFAEAVNIGREVIWLHTYGERYTGDTRPKSPPRLPPARAPRIPAAGALPPAPEPLPETMAYDVANKRLHIGKGFIDNVTPAMWAYEVSGKNTLTQWFSYRRRDRSKPIIGDRRPPSPLEKIIPDGWLHEYTTDLLELLHVLGRLIELEPGQTDILTRICDAPLVPKQDFIDAGLAAAEVDNSEHDSGE